MKTNACIIYHEQNEVNIRRKIEERQTQIGPEHVL